MDVTLLPITEVQPQQVERLAHLHLTVMHGLLTDLGLPFVERYYRLAVSDEKVLGFCALKGEMLQGWVTGSPYPQALNGRLRTPFSWFAMQMLRVLITRPRLIWQLAVSARSAGEEYAPKPGEIELTYIGVAPEAHGQGVGRALLGVFLVASRAAGYRVVSLSVETDNQAAISLYRAHGFQVVKAFTEGRYTRQRMELAL